MEETLQKLRSSGIFSIGEEALKGLGEKWASSKVNDQETLETIAKVSNELCYLIDPHTAVGYLTADRYTKDLEHPVVTLATAHPSKFPDAVQQACGILPELPSHLDDLYERKEFYEILPNDEQIVKSYILEQRNS